MGKKEEKAFKQPEKSVQPWRGPANTLILHSLTGFVHSESDTIFVFEQKELGAMI